MNIDDLSDRIESINIDRRRRAFRRELRRRMWRLHWERYGGWYGIAGVFMVGVMAGMWIAREC